MLSSQATLLKTVMKLHGLFSLPEVVGRGGGEGGPQVSWDRKRRMQNTRIKGKGGCGRCVVESMFLYTAAFWFHIVHGRRQSSTVKYVIM